VKDIREIASLSIGILFILILIELVYNYLP